MASKSILLSTNARKPIVCGFIESSSSSSSSIAYNRALFARVERKRIICRKEELTEREREREREILKLDRERERKRERDFTSDGMVFRWSSPYNVLFRIHVVR